MLTIFKTPPLAPHTSPTGPHHAPPLPGGTPSSRSFMHSLPLHSPPQSTPYSPQTGLTDSLVTSLLHLFVSRRPRGWQPRRPAGHSLVCTVSALGLHDPHPGECLLLTLRAGPSATPHGKGPGCPSCSCCALFPRTGAANPTVARLHAQVSNCLLNVSQPHPCNSFNPDPAPRGRYYAHFADGVLEHREVN